MEAVADKIVAAPRPVLQDMTLDDEHDLVVANLESQIVALRQALHKAVEERNGIQRALAEQARITTQLSTYCEQLAVWKRDMVEVIGEIKRLM